MNQADEPGLRELNYPTICGKQSMSCEWYRETVMDSKVDMFLHPPKHGITGVDPFKI